MVLGFLVTGFCNTVSWDLCVHRASRDGGPCRCHAHAPCQSVQSCKGAGVLSCLCVPVYRQPPIRAMLPSEMLVVALPPASGCLSSLESHHFAPYHSLNNPDSRLLLTCHDYHHFPHTSSPLNSLDFFMTNVCIYMTIAYHKQKINIQSF